MVKPIANSNIGKLLVDWNSYDINDNKLPIVIHDISNEIIIIDFTTLLINMIIDEIEFENLMNVNNINYSDIIDILDIVNIEIPDFYNF